MIQRKSYFVIWIFIFLLLFPIVYSNLVIQTDNLLLSNTNGINKTDITVINIQSYPIVGSQWTVRFTTVGMADLIISAVNGTNWRNNENTNDLEFQFIKKGDTTLEYEWIDNKICIRNFSSNEVCYEISKIFTQGKHTLMFKFGDDVAYANNDATNWWDSDWGCRKLITINSSQVNSDLSNFPVLINITDVDLRDYAQENGEDIAFIWFTDNTTKLNHEIEFFDGATGELSAWVNVTSISSSEDTRIWIYYNNSACSTQENPDGVWNSGYVGVWHLGENGVGNDNDYYDSTGNDYNGTGGGPPGSGDLDNTPAREEGLISYAQHFDGVNDKIFTPLISTDDWDEITIEAWIKPDTINDERVFSKSWGTGGDEQIFVLGVNSTNGGRINASIYTDGSGSGFSTMYGSGGIGTNAWRCVVITLNASTEQFELFQDGQDVGGGARDGDTLYDYTSDPYPCIGNYNGSDDRNFDGLIDECRISNIARNASWINTCFNNAKNTSTFVKFGNQENITDTMVDSIIPYKTSYPSIAITANAHIDLNNVTLWYRFSSDNSSWDGWMENETDTSVTGGWNWSFNFTLSNGTGYYEFYSVGKKAGCNSEAEPTVETPADAIVRATPYAPTITGENPQDESVDIILVPTLNVTIYDLNDDYLDVTWWSNSSGPWVQFASNENVDVSKGPVSIYKANSNFSDYLETYWWSVNVTDGNSWTNETYSFVTKQNIAPVINAYDVKNISGNSKKDNKTGLLINNNEYYFSINITDQNGWFDIEYIDIKAWYDNGSDSTTYNETKGGNINIFLRYENTSELPNFELIWPDDEAELILTNCTESVINETTRIVNISFKPKNQVRWASSNGTWTETDDAFDDPYSWNFEVEVNDSGDLDDIKKGEYGVDFFSCISVDPLWVEITSAPGFNDTSDIFTITYSANYDYKMMIFLEENLTHTECEATIPIKDNLVILENADPYDDITENITFTGTGVDHAVYIFTDSGIYPKNNISQDVDVRFRMYVPLGTISGTYSANIATKTIQNDD